MAAGESLWKEMISHQLHSERILFATTNKHIHNQFCMYCFMLFLFWGQLGEDFFFFIE